jgi:hypothetical protein
MRKTKEKARTQTDFVKMVEESSRINFFPSKSPTWDPINVLETSFLCSNVVAKSLGQIFKCVQDMEKLEIQP